MAKSPITDTRVGGDLRGPLTAITSGSYEASPTPRASEVAASDRDDPTQEPAGKSVSVSPARISRGSWSPPPQFTSHGVGHARRVAERRAAGNRSMFVPSRTARGQSGDLIAAGRPKRARELRRPRSRRGPGGAADPVPEHGRRAARGWGAVHDGAGVEARGMYVVSVHFHLTLGRGFPDNDPPGGVDDGVALAGPEAAASAPEAVGRRIAPH